MADRCLYTLSRNCASLLLVLCTGCSVPWLNDYDVTTFQRGRIDVLDGNNIWNPINPSEVATADERDMIVSSSIRDVVNTNSFPTSVEGTTQDIGDDAATARQHRIPAFSFSHSSFRVPTTIIVEHSSQLSFATRSHIQARGIQFERVARFDSHGEGKSELALLAENRWHSYFDISYGARYVEFGDSFNWQWLNHQVLAGTDEFETGVTSSSDSNNQAFGPQLGFRMTAQKNGWQFLVGSLCTFVAADHSIDQQVTLDMLNDDVIHSKYGEDGTSYPVLGELVAQASYNLSDSLAVQLGYSAMHLEKHTLGRKIYAIRSTA